MKNGVLHLRQNQPRSASLLTEVSHLRQQPPLSVNCCFTSQSEAITKCQFDEWGLHLRQKPPLNDSMLTDVLRLRQKPPLNDSMLTNVLRLRQ